MSIVNKGPSMFVANNDQEFINIINKLSGLNYSKIEEAITWTDGQDGIVVIKGNTILGIQDEENIGASYAIAFSSLEIPSVVSKGRARVDTNGTYAGLTHKNGFYTGIVPEDLDTYVINVEKNNGFINTDLLFFVDISNYSSYREDLDLDLVWDIGGDQHDMTLHNNPSYDLNSKGLLLNGSNQYTKTNDIIVSSPTELTIGGWIMKKNIGIGTYECALHHASAASVGSSSYWFGFQTTTNNICATIGANVSGIGWSAGLTNLSATYDTWYQVVASWDGSVVKVYINGEYNKQYNLASYTNLTTPTRIGACNDGTAYQFGGCVGEVWIYSKGLSESEIQQNYNASTYKNVII